MIFIFFPYLLLVVDIVNSSFPEFDWEKIASLYIRKLKPASGPAVAGSDLVHEDYSQRAHKGGN